MVLLHYLPISGLVRERHVGLLLGAETTINLHLIESLKCLWAVRALRHLLLERDPTNSQVFILRWTFLHPFAMLAEKVIMRQGYNAQQAL